MRVDIRRGRESGMAEPLLNRFHGNAMRQKQTGAGVMQIVKANFSKLIPLQQISEMPGDVVGVKQLAHLIHTDIVGVGIIVAFLK